MKKEKKSHVEDAGFRAARHLGEMAEAETLRLLADRHAAHGVIPASRLAAAAQDVRTTIADFERSPSGPSSRNALVLALVRHACTDRLRRIARRIDAAAAEPRDLPLGEIS